MASGKPNKYTAFYRCSGSITDLKLRIRIKEGEPDEIKANPEDGWRTKVFSWQEKHFSKIERDFYGDVNNCLTDLEKIYNERITNEPESNDQEVADDGDEEFDISLFTYVDGEGYNDEHENFHNNRWASYLQKRVEQLSINSDKQSKNLQEYDYEKSVKYSMENPIVETNFEKMYIMADFGEYVEDVWIRNEKLLLSVKFDKTSGLLSIYPDFTTTQPYSMKIHGETVRYIFYYVENVSSLCPESELFKEKDHIQKMIESKQSRIKQIIGDTFPLPPKNKMFIYIFFEILYGSNFENDDLFVKYTIDLPEQWNCDTPEILKGITQRCHVGPEDGLAHFAHSFDVVLQFDIQNFEENGIPKSPYIYFEVISKGSWGRHTTEGLTYSVIPVSKPGFYSRMLPCFRFNTREPVGNLKRFFIGDYPNYTNVKWIGLPNEQLQSTVINKYNVDTVGTGQLNVRFNIIYQSQAFLNEFNEKDHKEKLIYEKLNSSSLIRSVNQVLLAFKKAKKNLADARKDVLNEES